MSPRTIDLTGQNWYTQWIRNARLNGLLRDPSIQSIYGIDFGERDRVIVCGSGPSLMADLEVMKNDPAVIIANHSNFLTLFHHGIVPDFVVITDASKEICERLAKSLPYYSKQASGTTFVLATHVDHELVCLLRDCGFPVRFFLSVGDAIMKPEVEEVYNDLLQVMTEDVLSKPSENPDERLTPSLPQCGCVSNAELMLAYYAAVELKEPIKKVYLSGVDYSYPGGKARCAVVTYDEKSKGLIENVSPLFNPKDPERFTINGLLTDAVQLAYYNDLKFIAKTIAAEGTFKIVTTTNNFVSDFLPVEGL